MTSVPQRQRRNFRGPILVSIPDIFQPRRGFHDDEGKALIYSALEAEGCKTRKFHAFVKKLASASLFRLGLTTASLIFINASGRIRQGAGN
jgi:hypothetical protein